MNPPAPVTHIFNFFSGQYGSVPYTPRNSYPAAAMVRDRRVALCRRHSRRRSGRSTAAVPLTRVTSALFIVTDSRTRFTYSSSSIEYVLTHTCVRDIVRIYYTGSDPRVQYCEHL